MTLVRFGNRPKPITFEEFKAEVMKLQAQKKANAAKKAAKAN